MSFLRKICKCSTICLLRKKGSDHDFVSQSFPHRRENKTHKDSLRSSCENTPTDIEKGDWITIDLTESLNVSVRETYAGTVSLKHLIGYGSYGRVYRANIHYNGINSTVAVKVMIYDAKSTDKILQEINVMTQLRHKNIVCALRNMSWKRIPNEEEDDLNVKNLHQTWIVQEYCDGGTLSDAVKSGRLNMTNQKQDLLLILRLLLDVSEAMSYMHKHNVIHGDLKCSNIMLNTGGPSNHNRFVAKVCDFGLSHILANHVTHIYTVNMGTISHMSHEMLRFGIMSRASDVYAFGMVMFEVLTGKRPFDGMMQGVVVERVLVSNKQPVFPEHTPEHFVKIIKECWNPEPEKRPTFRELFVKLNKIKDYIKKSP